MVNIVEQKSHKKIIMLILLALAVIITTFFYTMSNGHSQSMPNTQNIKISGLYLTTPTTINDFQLTDNHGKEFTKANLNGHWTLLFFGFTNCGYVCPTTMAAMKQTYQTLQKEIPANQLPQVLFVSVDPDRDSVAKLNSYVTAFNPSFIGTRGDTANLDILEKQFHIVAVKVPGKGKNNYSINHTAEIMLINPNAKLQAFFSFPVNPTKMVTEYQSILKAFG
jgi:protein SCO1/2